MRKDKSIESRIKNVATTVTAIEGLRGRLFTKLLPPLYADHAARTIFCDGLIWVVVTSNQDVLIRTEKVILDNLADTGEHIKLFDESGEPIEPLPSDLVVLYSGAGQNPEIAKNMIEAFSENPISNHMCNQCKKQLTDDENYLRRDPFLWELHDKEVNDYWCDECYSERHLEV